ncbi:MAG: GTPase, partial [Actinomycetia bacterium]|nr:GTPase [Actinomycetes bacterium]
ELYPDGIPIYDEDDLDTLIEELSVDECVFSYSDVKYDDVMALSARVNAAGASFTMLGPDQTMLKSTKPVIAIGAARTGCGKSQTTRRVAEILQAHDLKPVVIRHPMPYGDLEVQAVQRFATLEDLSKHHCTIEEMEEYEPFIDAGIIVYAGVDYKAILRAAEEDLDGCDVILWDGGNNDFPFYRPDLMITLVDPHRPGDEISYYPGEVSLRLADAVVINKIDSADYEGIQAVRENVADVNPDAAVIEANSELTVDDADLIKDKRVLVIEDGPTLTHGGMKIGAGTVAADRFGAAEIVDPRPYVVGKLAQTFETYPDIGHLLPAMGYSDEQVDDLATTIKNAPCDSVIIATPIDLERVVAIDKPHTRVKYRLQEIGDPTLDDVLKDFVNSATS